MGESYPCHLRVGSLALDITGRVRWCVLKQMTPQPNGDTLATYYAGVDVVEQDQLSFQRILDRDPNGHRPPN